MENTKKYIVKSGDTLSEIAQCHGILLEELLDLNPKKRADPDSIAVDEPIIIPITVNDEQEKATNSQATREADSKNEPSRIRKTSNKISPRELEALKWARNRLGDSVQSCNSSGCLYNPDPNQRGETPCPTPIRDEEEIKKGNHKDFHSLWFYWCARFVQNAFGIRQQRQGSAIGIYHKLKQQGLVKKSNNVPEGALVFWDLTKYGHVGICSGNGNVIHTGTKERLKGEGIREDLISEISNKTYLGWAHVPTDWL